MNVLVFYSMSYGCGNFKINIFRTVHFPVNYFCGANSLQVMFYVIDMFYVVTEKYTNNLVSAHAEPIIKASLATYG